MYYVGIDVGGTNLVAGLVDREALEPGQDCYAQLRMTENLATKPGDRFVIRFYSPLDTIGGGVVLDDDPRRHKAGDQAVLDSIYQGGREESA